jgi:ribosomal protein S27AE
MPRSRKINREKVMAALNKTCPKCGFVITPDQVKRVDFERIECPKCGEKFQPNAFPMKAQSRATAARASN